ncbi:MAG: hypothetical protein KAT40_00010 [Bacteroidales bacterium]|nr:hypothetical protein [Bacteroidales bacterium]
MECWNIGTFEQTCLRKPHERVVGRIVGANNIGESSIPSFHCPLFPARPVRRALFHSFFFPSFHYSIIPFFHSYMSILVPKKKPRKTGAFNIVCFSVT